MEYAPDILDQFRGAYARDERRFAPQWLCAWQYQDVRRRRGERYAGELPQDFYTYGGPADLVRWFNWCAASALPDYFRHESVEPLIDMSLRFDQSLLERHALTYDWDSYRRSIGRYNAQDYILQNLYPVPERYTVKRILDFGAGYGRQANLWTQRHPEIVYVAMDAIPLSYCLQHLYYSHLRSSYSDYVLAASPFRVREEPGVYHLPTWRHDLLPSGFFDMVVCVQVLQELSPKLLLHILDVFWRVLRPGGALYVRDHEGPGPKNRLILDRCLEAHGFDLEFHAHAVDMKDLHGIPRVWRKPDPEVMASRRWTRAGLMSRCARWWKARRLR
ncbi:MAG: class I SAM-dependent methyltransferase [Candidatus Sumerlaeota bacterium]|nr:class I SAM-dependent methyltransferase [Candidatus Sumerlaeota bacterium]